MEDAYVYRNQKKLRRGYTTGTCAAAASKAAVWMLLTKERMESIRLMTPKGVDLFLSIEEIRQEKDMVSCAVRKDAGDDPDATDGAFIYAKAEYLPKPGSFPKEDLDTENAVNACYQTGDGPALYLDGGTGVGRVTKPGLSCPVGKAAINPVPREMIFGEVKKICEELEFTGRLKITISVPEGERIAEKTFNPCLGITGGISILGTSGIVEPMSEAALIETIRLSIKQKAALGEKHLLLVPGNYGETFLKESLHIDPDRAVKCSNYIGETLDMAGEFGFQTVLLIGHGGKLIKLAAGIMNTHSSMADGRMEILAAWSGACGAEKGAIQQILNAITVEQALEILEEQGLKELVLEQIMKRIQFYLKKRAGGKVWAEAILFTNQKGVLGMTSEAGRLLEEIPREQ
ncbi:MAG: cobalt-precorrin-5B (C(1))-methyltransferase CbiD [Lachnospiraceae bacterium]